MKYLSIRYEHVFKLRLYSTLIYIYIYIYIYSPEVQPFIPYSQTAVSLHSKNLSIPLTYPLSNVSIFLVSRLSESSTLLPHWKLTGFSSTNISSNLPSVSMSPSDNWRSAIALPSSADVIRLSQLYFDKTAPCRTRRTSESRHV